MTDVERNLKPDSNGQAGHSYDCYAKFCLRLAAKTPDRPSRLMLREMAADWLKLEDVDGQHRKRDGHELDGHEPDGHEPDGHDVNSLPPDAGR